MIIDKIREIIASQKDIELDKITPDTTFEELQLDSLDTVDIIMALEDEFSITIEQDDQIRSVNDLVKLIEAAQA